MTLVFNLQTNQEQWFLLPSTQKALVRAFLASQGSNNTWEPIPQLPIILSSTGRTATLGDFCVTMLREY